VSSAAAVAESKQSTNGPRFSISYKCVEVNRRPPIQHRGGNEHAEREEICHVDVIERIQHKHAAPKQMATDNNDIAAVQASNSFPAAPWPAS